jgi:hypothetical protein
MSVRPERKHLYPANWIELPRLACGAHMARRPNRRRVMTDKSEFERGFDLAKILALKAVQICRETGETDMRSVRSRISMLTPDLTVETMQDD